MNTTENLERVIEMMSSNLSDRGYLGVGIAQNINKEKRTCDIVVDDELTLLECRLNAVVDDYKNHVLILPTENTAVAYEAINGDFANVMVVSVSAIDAVDVIVADTSIAISKDGVVLNGGSVGATKTDKLVEKINALENNLNSILSVLKGITVVLAPSGTVPFAPFFSTINNLVTSTQAELEDAKLKH